MTNTAFLQKLIDSVDALSTEDQDFLIALVQQRRTEKRQTAMPHNNVEAFQTLKPRQRMQAFQEWVESHRAMELPDLSDEAISRESIYGERG
jgi:hypothetical protein